jgi:hypothetical protein
MKVWNQKKKTENEPSGHEVEMFNLRSGMRRIIKKKNGT